MAKSLALGSMKITNQQLGIALLVSVALLFTPLFGLGKLAIVLGAVLLLINK